MGQEAERARRLEDFAGFTVDDERSSRRATPTAIVLHCLPAHYGEEITEDVLYGPQSAVWDEAENRLHAQKALLALIIALVSSFEENGQPRRSTRCPPEIAGWLKNVAVVVEDENPDDPDILGLFSEEPYMPAQITIYRLPLEEAFPDPLALEEEIRITVLHEIGHYFGMDEEQISQLGYD